MTSPLGRASLEAKTDLAQNYRPLGLKAVLAAALMVRAKPAKKAA